MTVLVAIVVLAALTCLVMVIAARSPGQGKPGLARDVAPRFMGLIVLAMGVRFLLTGLRSFFAG